MFQSALVILMKRVKGRLSVIRSEQSLQLIQILKWARPRSREYPVLSPCGIHPKNESQLVNARTIMMGYLLNDFLGNGWKSLWFIQRLDTTFLRFLIVWPKAAYHANGPLPEHLIPIWVESHVSSGFDNWRTCVKRTAYAGGVRNAALLNRIVHARAT